MKIHDLAIALVIYLAVSMLCGYVDGSIQPQPTKVTSK